MEGWVDLLCCVCTVSVTKEKWRRWAARTHTTWLYAVVVTVPGLTQPPARCLPSTSSSAATVALSTKRPMDHRPSAPNNEELSRRLGQKCCLSQLRSENRFSYHGRRQTKTIECTLCESINKPPSCLFMTSMLNNFQNFFIGTLDICNKKAELPQRFPRDAPCSLCGCPENFREFLSTPTTTFAEIFNALLFRSILWMCAQN